MIVITSLLGSIAAAYLLLNLYIWNNRRKVRHFPSVPVERGFFWFRGCEPEIRRRWKIRKDAGLCVTLLDVLMDISKEYEWDVFAVPLLFSNMIYVQDLKGIGQILQDKFNFNKAPAFQRLFSKIGRTRVFGKRGIFSEPGTPVWAAKRRALEPAFHRSFLRTIMLNMNQITENLLVKLEAERKASEEAFDIAEFYNLMAFEAISICGFDWDPEVIEKHGNDILDATKHLFKCFQLGLDEMWTFLLPWCRRAEKALLHMKLEPVRALVREHLINRIEKLQEGNAGDTNILSFIIKANQISDTLDIEDLVDEYLTFLIAGMETTAITMAVTTFFLSVYPEVFARARKEVDTVLGGRKTVTFEDLGELKYLEKVINESLRLYPSGRNTMRIVVGDNICLDEKYVPKGTILMVPMVAVHYDPRYWEDPLTFNPDRFGPHKKRANYSFLPFLAGPRNCVGKSFAMLELKMVLARLIQNFELINPEPEVKKLLINPHLTARPAHGVKVRLLLREGREIGSDTD